MKPLYFIIISLLSLLAIGCTDASIYDIPLPAPSTPTYEQTQPPFPECASELAHQYIGNQWKCVMRKPDSHCSDRYPELKWNYRKAEWACYSVCPSGKPIRYWNAEHKDWNCYKTCNHGKINVYTSDNRKSCQWPEWCPAPLIAKEYQIKNIKRMRCVASDKQTQEFWQHAFEKAGILDKSHRWIGGLAFAYDKYFWFGEEDREHQGLEIEGDFWQISTMSSSYAFMEKYKRGQAEVLVCTLHDCEGKGRNSGSLGWTIGSTNHNSKHCPAWIWHDTTGLWFLMKITETSEICVEAYENVYSGNWKQASFGNKHSKIELPPITQFGRTGKVVMHRKTEWSEITLSPFGRNAYTWIDSQDLR